MNRARSEQELPLFARSPRVLILSASVGAGHVRAAQALEAAFGAGAFPGEARHLDLLRTVPAHGFPPLGTPMRGHVQSSGSGGKRRR